MTTKYYALLTEIGAAKLANATALGTKLQITQMAVGDGGGTLPTPGAKQTALIGEKRRAPLNSLSVDPVNSSQIVAEQIIPESEGGYWIREIGLFDADNALIAVANCAETYKPQLQEGSGRTQTVRMILIVSSTAAVTLKIDPSVVLATRKYVDDKVIEVKAYMDAGLAGKMDKANNGADIANPDAFVANLGLGSAEGRLRAGFFTYNQSGIAQGINLNSLLLPGIYFQNYDARANILLNYPLEGVSGNLNVYRNAANGMDGCIQEYSLYKTGETYRRVYLALSKTWSSWNKVMEWKDVSAVITSQGSNINGKWRRFSDGSIEMSGRSPVISDNGVINVTYPVALPGITRDISITQLTNQLATGLIATIVSDTSFTPTGFQTKTITANGSPSTSAYMWRAFYAAF